jgi:hypothetical protein
VLTYATGPTDAAVRMAAHLALPTITPRQAALDAHYADAPGSDPRRPDLFTHTIARVRHDLDPALGALLGLAPRRAPSQAEIVQVLAGRRADGSPVPGRQTPRARQPSLASELGLEADRVASAACVDRVLEGRRADTGEAFPPVRRDLLIKRFYALYGAHPGIDLASTAVREVLRQGKRLDGTSIHLPTYRRALGATPQSLGFIDLTLSADKTLSIAAALAPTQGERALLLAAHREAVEATLRVAAGMIGRARRGAGGCKGSELGAIAWLTFEHHTARPTRGPDWDGADTAWIAGACQLHSHALIPALVLTPAGHIGGLDLEGLKGSVHELGALYQASAATRLRALGVTVELDAITGAARLSAIPDHIRAHFSRRSLEGLSAARTYARQQGEDWVKLSPAQQIVRWKAATQDPRGARADDCGCPERWRGEAEALGWTPSGVINLDAPSHPLPGDERLALAARTATGLLAHRLTPGAQFDEMTLRLAAIRGLIVSGYHGPENVDGVVRLLERSIGFGRHPLSLAVSSAWNRRGRTTRIMTVVETGLSDPDTMRETGLIDAPAEMGGLALTAADRISGVLDDLRVLGRAHLAPGAPGDVVASVTRLWQQLRIQRPNLPDSHRMVVAANEAEARVIGAAIRASRQAMGECGPDQIALEAIDPDGGAFTLPIGIGDTLRLGARINAGGPGGRGLLGTAGSLVTVVEIVEAAPSGLRLRNTRGREGLVTWATLRDPVSGRYRLTFGDCTSLAQVRQVPDELILALPSGTATCRPGQAEAVLCRSAKGAFIVLGEEAERRAISTKSEQEPKLAGADQLWRHIGVALSRQIDPGYALADQLMERTKLCRDRAGAVRRLAFARLEPRAVGLSQIAQHLRRRVFADLVRHLDDVGVERAALCVRLNEVLDRDSPTLNLNADQSLSTAMLRPA